jgi:hypothetical protein
MALCVGVIADYNTIKDAAQRPVAAGVPRQSNTNAMTPLRQRPLIQILLASRREKEAGLRPRQKIDTLDDVRQFCIAYTA